MLVAWVIEWSTSWMPHRRTFMHFTHRACWATWDLSNHYVFWIIPDPDSHRRVTLSLESICTIPFQAWARDVRMPKLRQHCSNCGMPCFVNIVSIFRGTYDQSGENPGSLVRCTMDIVSNITNWAIQRPGRLITRKIGQRSLVRCRYDCHNHPSSRKLILCIQPPVARVHPAVDWTTLRVSDAHWFKIEVCLKWEICYEGQDIFENFHVVYCSEDMWVIINPTIIAKPEIKFRE